MPHRVLFDLILEHLDDVLLPHKEIGVPHRVLFDLILEHLDDVLLPHHFPEGLRAVPPIERRVHPLLLILLTVRPPYRRTAIFS